MKVSPRENLSVPTLVALALNAPAPNASSLPALDVLVLDYSLQTYSLQATHSRLLTLGTLMQCSRSKRILPATRSKRTRSKHTFSRYTRSKNTCSSMLSSLTCFP